MPFSNVDVTHSLEYFRTVTNQVVQALNYFHGNTLAVTGGITINPPTGLHSSLNVTNGIILGNGFLLTSISPTGLSGRIAVANVQNSSLTVLGINGLAHGGTVSLGNTITINLSLVDSTVNSRINLAMSANAVTTLATELLSYGSNASLRTIGLVSQANGGLEFASYTNGQILLSNGISSRLEKNTIEQGSGVTITNRAGNIALTANLISGINVSITPVGVDGIQISQNTQPAASKTSLGIVSLDDTVISTSITQAASANALNAMAKLLLTTTGATKSGRLIRVDSYQEQPHLTIFAQSLANSYTWTNPDFGNVDYIIVEVLGAGGSAGQIQGNTRGSQANSFPSRWTVASGGGGGGGYIKAKITSPNASYTVVVGRGGGSNPAGSIPSDGNTGGQSIFGTNLLIANGGFGGANSRAYHANSSWTAFGNIASGVVGTRGMGGSTSNVANGVGNCQVLFASPGGDCGDIFSIMGGRVNTNGNIGNLDPMLIESAGGNPGWPWGEGLLNGTNTDNANTIPGVGSQGESGTNLSVPQTYAASNGAVIVWTYSKTQ